jgi:ACS family hexuronate transporter-like MFS transporter
MTQANLSPDPAADRMRWAALALVFTAAMINYIDRQAIAVLKPALEAEFGWSAQDYAHIVSGFQLATIASILAVGWFVDKVGLRSGYAIGVATWSLAGMAHAFVTTITGFIGVRIILGVTEAVNTPAAVKTVATWFRGKDRSLALGIMNTAPNIGAVATPLVVPAIALALGWKMAFIITGALGFLWLAFWLILPRPPAAEVVSPTSAPVENQPGGVKLGTLLKDRRAWAVALAKFMTDFVFAFMLFWAPDLFVRRYGLDMAGFALPIATIFLMAAAGSLFGGWMSSTLLRAGKSLNTSRKTPMSVSAVCALPVPLVMITPEPWIAVALVGLVLAAHQCFSTNVFGLITDIFPSRTVGMVAGFGATFGGLSGLAMNEFAGIVLDTTASYLPMLLLCGLAYVTALTTLHLIIPDIDKAKDDALTRRSAVA